MKVVSIGRSPENMIIIDDMMVSRRHAIIRITSLGKYELVSSGTNGTKVNGNQVSPNVPYPLKRGDSVIFANVAPLDWNRVPNPLKPYKIGSIAVCIACALALVIAGIVKLVNNYSGSEASNHEPSLPVEQADSVKNNKEKETNDTVKKDTDKSVEGAISFDEVIKSKKTRKKSNESDIDSKRGKDSNVENNGTLEKKSKQKDETTKSESEENWGRR